MDDVLSPSDRELRALLGDAETIAIVGLSPDPERPSRRVASYLRRHGYRIVPVNPLVTEIEGERAYASLAEIGDAIVVDVVDVFRRAEHTPAIAREAVALGARVLWLQEGVVNQEAAQIAADAGLDVIMGVCIAHTRARLMEETDA